MNLGVGSPAPPGTVASGPRGARPLTVLLSIVAQLLIGCCSCSGQPSTAAPAGSPHIRPQRWWAHTQGGD